MVEGKPDELAAGETIRTLVSFVAPVGVDAATIAAEAGARARVDGRRIELETDDAQRTLSD